jgi:Fe2+ or Zn2+ uptake regulation protein
MTNQDTVSQPIIKYLQSQPQAGDTLEGIVSWWLLRQQVEDSLASIQQVLDRLALEGIVKQRRGPDGRRFYFAQHTD